MNRSSLKNIVDLVDLHHYGAAPYSFTCTYDDFMVFQISSANNIIFTSQFAHVVTHILFQCNYHTPDYRNKWSHDTK